MTTLSIMTLSKITLSIIKHIIMTLSIIAFRKKGIHHDGKMVVVYLTPVMPLG